MTKSYLKEKMNRREILRVEFYPKLIRDIQNKLIASWFRYGPSQINVTRIDFPEQAKVRLELYRDGGNTDDLLDAIVFLMHEYHWPQHKKAYFNWSDNHDDPDHPSRLYAGKTAKDIVRPGDGIRWLYRYDGG